MFPSFYYFFILYMSFSFFDLIVVSFILGFSNSFLIRLYDFSVYPRLSWFSVSSHYCPSYFSLYSLAFLFISFLSRLYSLLFLWYLRFLLCSIRILVFSLIHGSQGYCFNFPNAFCICCYCMFYVLPLLMYICCLCLCMVQILLYLIIIVFYFSIFLNLLTTHFELLIVDLYIFLIYVSWQLRYGHCIYHLPGMFMLCCKCIFCFFLTML
jgi:hypothetical protein